jgi:probable phosphoglycerate mutase
MTVPEVDELDIGAWTGRSFEELETDPHWHVWNRERGSARPPDGESMDQLQERVLDHLAQVKADYPNDRIVIVSHAEPIRAAVLHYRGMRMDDFASVKIDPASVTTLVVHRNGGEVISANESFDVLESP